MRRLSLPLVLLVLAALACNFAPPAPPPTATATLTATPSGIPPSATAAASATVPATAIPSATAALTEPPPTETPAATATVGPSATDTPAQAATTEPAASGTPAAKPGGQGNLSFVAYVLKGQLLVTDVTGGVVGGTTQYTQAAVNDGVYDLVWSPSGEFIAFTSAGNNRDAHVFVVHAIGAGTPVDLGLGSQPSWSPDSTRIAFVREGNIWITLVDNPQPQQLTNQQRWGWGRPVFTPAGDALVVSGQSADNMGAQGNTEFDLETLPLDGSGTLTPLPGMTAKIDGRLPYDLRFSPDGTKLSFSTSWHLSACASAGQYYVANADGSQMTQLSSSQLSALLQAGQDFYYLPEGYAWNRQSDGLLISSFVVDCTNFAGTHLGDTLSAVTLTGNENVLSVGFYGSPSYDRTGSLIAVGQPDTQGAIGQVVLLDATGHLVATVGPGDLPQMQP